MVKHDTENVQSAALRKLFQESLNRSGHPFQNAVLRRVDQMFQEKVSPWSFEVAEFPVNVNGFDTRIDFILSRYPQGGSYGFLIAECKRANPSLKDWVFAKTSYRRRGRTSPVVLTQMVKRDLTLLSPIVERKRWPGDDVYDIGFEIKRARIEEGKDPFGSRTAIEDAAKQVIRGVSGLLQCIGDHVSTLPDSSPPAFFVPVIFTTAHLWVTGVDIAEADLESGNVDLTNSELKEKPWIWLQYPVSPTLRHSLGRDHLERGLSDNDTLAHLLDQEYTRTIAIVGTSGIEAFLRSGWKFWDN